MSGSRETSPSDSCSYGVPLWIVLLLIGTMSLDVRAEEAAAEQVVVIAKEQDKGKAAKDAKPAVLARPAVIAKPAVEAKPAAKKPTAKAKPKAKPKGKGGVIKALFKAFVPAAPVLPQPRPSDGQIGDLSTPEKVAELEKKIRAKPNGAHYIKRVEKNVKTIVNGELRFLHDVCPLKRSQFRSIQGELRTEAKKAVLTSAVQQMMMEGAWNGGMRRQQKSNTGGMLEDLLLATVKKMLTPEQSGNYQEEIEARRLFRRTADAEVIISSLDRDLSLAQEQRQHLIEPLRQAWKHEWRQNIELIAHNGNQYLPKLPNATIRKVLTDRQRTIFASMGQHSNVFFGVRNDMPQGVNVVENLEDELEFIPEETP